MESLHFWMRRLKGTEDKSVSRLNSYALYSELSSTPSKRSQAVMHAILIQDNQNLLQHRRTKEERGNLPLKDVRGKSMSKGAVNRIVHAMNK